MNDNKLNLLSTEAIKKMVEVRRIIKTKEEYDRFIKQIKKIILILKKAIKNKSPSIKNFSRVETNLTLLEIFLVNFKRQFNLN